MTIDREISIKHNLDQNQTKQSELPDVSDRSTLAISEKSNISWTQDEKVSINFDSSKFAEGIKQMSNNIYDCLKNNIHSGETDGNDKSQSVKEVVIKYINPHKFQVFINGIELKHVKRFAIDIVNPGMNLKDTKTPTYTVEHYLTSNKT